METTLHIYGKTVLIVWEDDSLSEAVARLFSPWRSDRSDACGTVVISGAHPPYRLEAPNAIKLCPDEAALLVNLEYSLTLLFQELLNDRVQIHGACIGIDGDGVMLCGPHASGKTTLALTALSSGFRAVSDDICLMSGDLNMVMGFPRPFKATSDTWNMEPRPVPDDCPVYHLPDGSVFVFHYLPPCEYYAGEMNIKHVVFPVRKSGRTAIRAMGETEALRLILPRGFNFYLKGDHLVKDMLLLLNNAPPLEIVYQESREAVRLIRESLA